MSIESSRSTSSTRRPILRARLSCAQRIVHAVQQALRQIVDGTAPQAPHRAAVNDVAFPLLRIDVAYRSVCTRPEDRTGARSGIFDKYLVI